LPKKKIEGNYPNWRNLSKEEQKPGQEEKKRVPWAIRPFEPASPLGVIRKKIFCRERTVQTGVTKKYPRNTARTASCREEDHFRNVRQNQGCSYLGPDVFD